MKKSITMLIAAAAAAIAFAAPASAADEVTTSRIARPASNNSGGVGAWIAFASTPQGRVFRSDIFRTEEGARQDARVECERVTARTCASTISVVPDFDVVIVRCQGPAVFMGASRLGYAEAGALSKARDAGYGGCQTIYTY
jgi:hypothetical protein